MAARKKATSKKASRPCHVCQHYADRERGLPTADLLVHVRDLYARALAVYDATFESRPHVALRATAEAARHVELLARLRGDLDTRAQVHAKVDMRPQPKVVLMMPDNGRGRLPPGSSGA